MAVIHRAAKNSVRPRLRSKKVWISSNKRTTTKIHERLGAHTKSRPADLNREPSLYSAKNLLAGAGGGIRTYDLRFIVNHQTQRAAPRT